VFPQVLNYGTVLKNKDDPRIQCERVSYLDRSAISIQMDRFEKERFSEVAPMDVKLTNLGKLMEGCWSRAEDETIRAISRKHPAPHEDEITFLFCGELRTAVREASDAGRVEMAFSADLRQSIPTLDFDITRWTRGLVARVNRHGRAHEGKLSGADLGIVIMRPLVQFAFGGTSIEFSRDHATGLLAQAKLGRESFHSGGRHAWDGLTRSQERLYPKRREYYSLLLYRLNGQNADELRPFGWQLCKQHTLRQTQKWLRSDAFPEEISSSEILRRLFVGSIGTENPKLIKSVIDPPNSEGRSITLHIFWPDGAGPSSSRLLHRQTQEHRQLVQRIRQ
jgi:hypothetical protein